MINWQTRRNEFLALARDAEVYDYAGGLWLRKFAGNCELLASDDPGENKRGSELLAENFSRYVRDIVCPEMGVRLRAVASVH